MLVLSRKVHERLLIFVPGREQPIVVEVTGIERRANAKKDVAKIGVEADPDIRILRDGLVAAGYREPA